MVTPKEKKKIQRAARRLQEKEEITREKTQKILEKIKKEEKIEGKEEKFILDQIANDKLKKLLKKREEKFKS